MHLRPPARLLASAGALALAATLSSCGFNYATDRTYTPGAAVNDRDATVDVLGALVVSSQEGSGRFIAAFSNNDESESATVQSIAGTGDDASLKVKGFTPVDLGPGALVNLQQQGGLRVSGDFAPGDFISMEFQFGDGESAQIDVPVYPPCNEFTGLDGSSSSSSTSVSSPSPSSYSTASSSPSSSTSTSPSSSSSSSSSSSESSGSSSLSSSSSSDLCQPESPAASEASLQPSGD